MLLEVPLSCCISSFCDDPDEVVSQIAAVEPPESTRTASWNVQLTCSVLLHQQDASSPAAPLLDSWPEAPPLPLFCTPADLSHASDDVFKSRVREQQQTAEAQRRFALRDAEKAGDVALATVLADSAAYLDAFALVSSRALQIFPPPPVGARHVLVPLLDLANHADAPTATFFFSPTRGGMMRLHATRELAAGDEVTICYAEGVGSGHFAQYYGFVPHDHRHNCVEIELATLMAGEGWSEERLREHGVLHGCELHELYAPTPAPALLATLGALLAGDWVTRYYGWKADVPADVDLLFSPGADDDVAEAVFRCVRRGAAAAAAQAEAAAAFRVDVGDAAADVAPRSAAAQSVLAEVGQSALTTLRALEVSAGRLEAAFALASAAGESDGGEASARARSLLEAAFAEIAPTAAPIGPERLEAYAAREWDWGTSQYT